MADYLNFQYDPEIFQYYWDQATDPVMDALLGSGAMVSDQAIAELASSGSAVYTMPYYDLMGGEEDNLDGKTNLTTTEVSGKSTQGVVYGRGHGFKAVDFVKTFNSGADPLAYAATKVGDWYNHRREKRVLGILSAVSQDATFAKANVVDATGSAIAADTLGAAAVRALGDRADTVTLAVMHSAVASRLASMQLLEFAKYTDASGVGRQVRGLGYVNGMQVVIDDSVPYTPATTGGSATPARGSVYLLGEGFLRFAPAKLDQPSSEYWRDPATNGGESVIYTRVRETIHPYGFTFKAPSGMTASPTDAQLAAKANWSLAYDAKTVPFVVANVQL